MDLIKRALLGDKKAQEELTEKGELLSCPFCGSKDIDFGICTGTLKGFDYIQCENCFFEITDVESDNLEDVREKWNTRPQILTNEEMERLEGRFLFHKPSI